MLNELHYIALPKQFGKTKAMYEQETPLVIRYTNWEGKTEVRRIFPKMVFFGSTYYYPKRQWLMTAHDLDKNDTRTFAMANMEILKDEGLDG